MSYREIESNFNSTFGTANGPTTNLSAYDDEEYRLNKKSGSKCRLDFGTFYSNFRYAKLETLIFPNAVSVLLGRDSFIVTVGATTYEFILTGVTSSGTSIQNVIPTLNANQIAYILTNTLDTTGATTLATLGLTCIWGQDATNAYERCFQFIFTNSTGSNVTIGNGTANPLLGFKSTQSTYANGVIFTPETYPDIHPTRNIYVQLDGAVDPSTLQGSAKNPMRAPFKAALDVDSGGITVYQSNNGEDNVVYLPGKNGSLGSFVMSLTDDNGNEIDLRGGNYTVGFKLIK